MRIICGLLAADDGAVTWRGKKIDGVVREPGEFWYADEALEGLLIAGQEARDEDGI